MEVGRVPNRAWPAAVLLAVIGGLGCGLTRSHPPTLAFLGDSITYGVVRGTRGGRPMEVDPHGGYPGRLARRLGDRARVLNRGIGGATTGFWTAAPDDPVGRAMWALVERAAWFEPGLVPHAESVALAVLEAGPADVVVLLLGVNDIFLHRREGGAGVALALDGLERLAREAHTVAPTVLVATPLPNRRDPPVLLAALTAGIHERFPDALPLGERVSALRWPMLLADDVHPNEAGHERIAVILEALLIERGIVAPAP